MLGAIIGDIIGSTYEFQNTNDYNFPLFPEGSTFTDDTICTIAIADAILKSFAPYRDSLIEWCRRYPEKEAMFGTAFSTWFKSDDPHPYESFANGAAMRCSPCGWAAKNRLDAALEGEDSAGCSHNHPEGLRGARTISDAVYILSNYHWRKARAMVYDLVCKEYGDDWEEKIPQRGQWDATCRGCVPLAFHIFFESESFEDAIRLAISYGGDSDTMGAIVGSLAGAYYEIPEHIYSEALDRLPKEMIEIIYTFAEKFQPCCEYSFYIREKFNIDNNN